MEPDNLMKSYYKNLAHLTDAAADPIRISAYYDSSINSLSASNQAYLKKTLSAAINYYQNFVQVIPVSGTWFFDRCSSWWTTNGYRKCATYQTTAYCQSSPVPADHYGDLKLYSSSTQSYSIVPGGDGIILYTIRIFCTSESECKSVTVAHYLRSKSYTFTFYICVS